MSIFPGPYPPYNNPPIESQFYAPTALSISNVQLGLKTTVTTSVNHQFVIGQLCRLLIPVTFGCRQLNEKSAYVIAIPTPNSVVLL